MHSNYTTTAMPTTIARSFDRERGRGRVKAQSLSSVTKTASTRRTVQRQREQSVGVRGRSAFWQRGLCTCPPSQKLRQFGERYSCLISRALELAKNRLVPGRARAACSPFAQSGSGMLRTSSGRGYSVPVAQVAMPAVGSSAWDQAQRDARYMALKYIADRMAMDMKLSMDKAALEQYITDIIMWRKLQYGGNQKSSPK
ncbi:hypothetical protein BaRGS_00022751 [Batillaria attramentaria]|uniref:Uncharacterized protein n=1 Tax=Batillaria attramentaria TaxID=370345 RepID=A0ABD0KG37_9CAEN